MDIATILTRKYPGQEWTLDGDTYAGLQWLSATAKPSETELSALWDEVQAEIQAEADTKTQARLSAIAKLEALGLTVDEVRVAFGLEA